MATLVPTPLFIKKWLSDAKLAAEDGYDGWLTGLKVAASTTPIVTGVDGTLAADVTVPVYTGYADQALTFGTAFVREDGKYAVDSALMTFQETSTLTTTEIVALAVYLDDGSDNIYFAVNLDVPVNLATADDALKFILEFVPGQETCGTLEQVQPSAA